MNEVIKAIKERRSVRSFKPDLPPKELIDQVIEAGLYAASGMGQQPVITIAVTDPAMRARISDANRAIMGAPEGTDPFYGAPVILVVLANKNRPTTYMNDGSLVLGNMMLAAHSLGLGSIWIHRAKEEFEQPEFKKLLKDRGIEGEWEGIGHCAIGWAAGPIPPAKERKPGRVYYI